VRAIDNFPRAEMISISMTHRVTTSRALRDSKVRDATEGFGAVKSLVHEGG